MEEIVIGDRAVARVLAVLPAVVVAVCVRVLTLGAPPVAVRAAAAGVVAVSCWTAYRLLTAKVVVDENAVHVRDVFYEATVPWAELQSVELVPATLPVRLLVWGVMSPNGVRLQGRTRALRPIAMLSAHDDEQVERAVGAMTVRMGAWRVPEPRESVGT
jgi:hypothetical protein